MQTWDPSPLESHILSTGVNVLIALCGRHPAWPGPHGVCRVGKLPLGAEVPSCFPLCCNLDPYVGGSSLPQEAFSLLLQSCTGSWAYAVPQPLVTFLEPTFVPPCPSLQGAPRPPALLLSLEMMSCLQLEPCCLAHRLMLF